MNKIKIIFPAFFPLFLLFIYFAMMPVFHNKVEKEQVEQETQVQELHIPIAHTTSRNTNGTLTIYDKDGNVWYEYAGEINVENSGEDGNPVEISITIPEDRSGTQLMEVPID